MVTRSPRPATGVASAPKALAYPDGPQQTEDYDKKPSGLHPDDFLREAGKIKGEGGELSGGVGIDMMGKYCGFVADDKKYHRNSFNFLLLHIINHPR